MDHTGTIVAERFELEKLAGRGGMGAVYRAKDRQTGNFAAVKILRDETTDEHRERFIREARVMSELTHPAFVRCLGFGSEGERPYLAMEWLEGEDLAQRLQREPLTTHDTLRLVARVAAALGSAHSRGIVHRDVKPSNLFLVDGDVDRVKVLDFGIAQVARNGSAAMTRTGATLGTPRYMAPEQARGGKEVDPRADVFSLGCVLFECLVGHPPFGGDNPIAVLMKILLDDAPRISTILKGAPASIDDLVARMMDKEPTARPVDGLAVASQLEAIGPIEGIGPTEAPERDSAVTIGEQRLVSVVLATTHVVDRPLVPPLETAPTMASEPSAPSATGDNSAVMKELTRRLAATVSEYRGRSAVLPDGTIAVTIAGQGAATDQAARAARCALAIRDIMPGSAMALAIGRSVTVDRAVGEVIDRAAAMLRIPTESINGTRPIRVDEVAAGLLDVRFAIHGDETGLLLARERDVTDIKRTLLGKPTPCVGRERELGTLHAMFAECVSEPKAHIVVVTAPAGVGKSRLRHELAQRIINAGGPQPELWIARGDPLSAGAPFAMLAQLLRRLAGIIDDEPLSSRQRKLKARVLRNVTRDGTRITEFLGELAGAPSRDEPSLQLRAARQDPQLMGDQMLRAWEDFVEAETGAGPIVIMLEDLHWGDMPTVRAMDTIIRQLPERPLFVLALARPEVDSVFPRLWHERNVERISLGELTRRAAEKLIREALGNVDAAMLTRLIDRAAGNAFYLEELIRSVAEGKGDRLPETVVAMAQARIEGLELDARQVLRAASIFGFAFWPAGVAALLEGNVEVSGWIEQLVERELVTPMRESRLGEEREYRFRHALVREAAYAMLPERDRKRGHFRAGEWLESAFRADDHGAAIEAVVLAEHFERGGEPRRASGWYQRAAEQALEADDLAAAIDRAERAITALQSAGTEISTEDRERIGVLRQLQSDAHIWRGEYPASAERGCEALDALPPASVQWLNAAATVADAWCRLLVHGDVVELCKTLVDLPLTPELHSAYTHAVAMTMPTVLWHTDGNIDAALFQRLDSVEAALDQNDPIALGWSCCARSWRALRDGDLGECHRLDSMIVECFTAVADQRHVCQQRAYVGYDELMIGAYPQAEQSLREAIAMGERMGLHQVTAQAQHNLGLVLCRLGRLDEARAVETAAMRALDEQGNRRLAITARNYLGIIEIEAGNFAEAIRYVTDAIDNGGDMQSALTSFLATASTACRLSGDNAGALSHAKRALELIALHGRPEEGEAAIRLAFAHALRASGQHEESLAAIRSAEEELLAAAAKIKDERWRSVFLESVPENAETIALARAWR
ncbi:MAG TPA: protein kinase [Kofleriaceae bacterium]|nr:protein kinase [Kofleriaceae bacterium]